MSHKDNFYPSENKYDRKKESKYEVGDLIEEQTALYLNKRRDLSRIDVRRLIVVEKYKGKDQYGTYWRYDVLRLEDNQLHKHVSLMDESKYLYRRFTKIA
jgi:hypothetical protein